MKKQGFLKSAAVVTLISVASQILPFAAFANVTEAHSAEYALLEQSIALSANKLDKKEMQNEMTALTQKYIAEAPVEGRIERMEQAMIDLNLYTPAQAEQVAQQLQISANSLANQSFANQQEALSATQAELNRVMNKLPAGAQYSDDAYCVLGPIAWGTAALLMGYIVLNAANFGTFVLAGFFGAAFGWVTFRIVRTCSMMR
jgi:hypothetical protein